MRIVLFLCALLYISTAFAQKPLGTLVASFPVDASKMLADPGRNRVYIADSEANTVTVVDTATLTSTTLSGFSAPVDLSISPDDETLYVANSGSSLKAISVIDLGTLAVTGTIELIGSAESVVAGPNDQLFVQLNNSSVLFDVDASTGTTTTPFGDNFFGSALALGPDGKTLYVSDNGLRAYDVSQVTPSLLLSNGPDVGNLFSLSHNGETFCVPDGENSGPTSTSTTLYSTADLDTADGSFSSNNSPDSLVFSPDDSQVYQLRIGTSYFIDVFSTLTFSETNEITVPAPGIGNSLDQADSIIIDNSGAYLFCSEVFFDPDEGDEFGVVVISTGASTPTPSPSPSPSPTATPTPTVTPTPTPTVSPTPTISPTPTPTATPNPTGTPKPSPTPFTPTPTPSPTATPAPTPVATPTPTPTPIPIPSVTISTVGDGDAVEGGEAAKFVIRRMGGDTTLRLLVRFKVVGAVAGVDYKPLPGSIILPSGVTQMKVKLKAIADSVPEGTRVAKVKLLPSLDGTYSISSPAVAKIKIVDGE